MRKIQVVFTGVPHDLEYDLDVCFEAYDIPAQDVYERVAFTNAYYGGKRLKAQRLRL